MPSIPKKVLVIAHDPILKNTRVAILKRQGYEVSAAETQEEALARIEAERFDLVLVGRKSINEAHGVDMQIRQWYPTLPILKIALIPDADAERYVDAYPEHVIDAVRKLLGE